MEWTTSLAELSTTQLAVLVPTALVTADAVRRYIRNRIERKGYPLPPGPTPLPFVGNLLSLNPRAPWITYTEWGHKYGEIVRASDMGNHMIILNTVSVAKELLEKRSQIYSDRPFIETLKPFGHDGNLSWLRYGPEWRLGRRIIHQTFRAEAAISFRPMQVRWAHQTVLNIADNPKEYPFYFSTFASAVALSAVYDYEPEPREDPLVTLVDEFVAASLPALVSEKLLLIKIFPFLLDVPEWIPRLSWINREAREARALLVKAVDTPYKMVQQRIASKEVVGPSTMVYDHIHRMEKVDGSERAAYEKSLKYAAVTSFIGATETTSSTLLVFTLGMVKNPRLWKRAQADIDSVIGTDRLPEFEDRPSLPYVDAILRETYRWRPVVAMGVPHATTTSDIYNGYYIPGGATVISNLWAMSRDESRYPDPEAFLPERFLDSRGALTDDNPAEFTFGFGRRVCPGRYTADASVWIAIATMLATLDFNLAKDANGKDIDFEPQYSTGITQHPVPFPCNLTLRKHVSRASFQRAATK